MQGGRKTASAYAAIGAAQVAKASFLACDCLPHRRRVAIWPIYPLPDRGGRGGRDPPHLFAPSALRASCAPGRAHHALAGLGARPQPALRANDPQTDAWQRRGNASVGRAPGLRSGWADTGMARPKVPFGVMSKRQGAVAQW